MIEIIFFLILIQCWYTYWAIDLWSLVFSPDLHIFRARPRCQVAWTGLQQKAVELREDGQMHSSCHFSLVLFTHWHLFLYIASLASEVSAVLRQNGQVAFSLAALDRARSKHRHILKIPWSAMGHVSYIGTAYDASLSPQLSGWEVWHRAAVVAMLRSSYTTQNIG